MDSVTSQLRHGERAHALKTKCWFAYKNLGDLTAPL